MEFQRFSAPDPVALDASISQTRAKLSEAIAARDASATVEHAADLGSMLTTARQEHAALALLQEHASLAEGLPASEAAGWYWNSYATAMQYFGQRSEANAFFAKALSLCQAGGWRRLESFVQQHWGRCLVEQGHLGEAEARFQAALGIRRELNDPRQSSTERALAALAVFRQQLEASASGGPNGAA